MQRLARFANRHAVWFCLAVTVLFVAVIVVAGIAAFPVEGEAARAVVSGVVMLVGVGCFVLVLRGLGWLGPAGVARLGSRSAWLLLAWVIVYLPVITVVAFFVGTEIALPTAGVSGALAFNNMVDAGLLQEIAFRGLVLYALVRAWERRNAGLLRAIGVSAVLFSAVHVLNVAAGREGELVALQMVDTLLAGLYLGVFVVVAASVWPAVLMHGLGNTATTVLAAGTSGFAETPEAWQTRLVLQVPVYVFAIYLAHRLVAQSSSMRPPRQAGPSGAGM
jgi:membrane protease YdiL (CAAX protease family)